jgi:hypothetical protein
LNHLILKKLARHTPLILLGVSIVLFAVFALLRALPQNSDLPQYKTHLQGAHQARIYDVFTAAGKNAAEPFFYNYDNLIFREHDPGLFGFVAEIFIRLGAQSPLPIQLLSIVMFVLGILANYFWVKIVFNSRVAAAISASFLALSPYLLYHSVSIHADPYEFLFFNLTVLLFATYFKFKDLKHRNLLLAGGLISYFILTQNYYMFHVSTFVVVAGLSKFFIHKVITKPVILMMLVAIFSFGFTTFWVMMAHGGLSQGISELQNQILYWTIDENKVPTSAEEGENKKVVGLKTYLQLPELVTERVEAMYILAPLTFVLIYILALNLSPKIKSEAVKYNQLLMFIFVGGMAWYIVFLQHTFVHKFAGIYSFFVWSTLAGASGSMIYQYLRTRPKVNWKSFGFTHLIYLLVAALTVLSLLLGFYTSYVKNIVIYLQNF